MPTTLVRNSAKRIRNALQASPRQYVIYVLVYAAMGFTMNQIGKWGQIAYFAHDWQVLTCYVLYLVPISLLTRGLPTFRQYAYGVVALVPLEILGYALGTSIAL